MTPDTLPGRLGALASDRPDETACWVKRRGLWQRTSWRQAALQAARAAAALAQAGVGPGQRVLLVGDPEPELHWAAHAVMSLGASVVALDPAADAGRLASAAVAAGVGCALVRDEEQAVKLARIPASEAPLVFSWRIGSAMEVCGGPVRPLPFSPAQDQAAPCLPGLAQGSGHPAFVTLDCPAAGPREVSHEELLATAETLGARLDLRPAARYFCAMPLAFGEARAMLALAVALPMTTCFPESPDQLEANLVELQPEVSLMDGSYWNEAAGHLRQRVRPGLWRMVGAGSSGGWLRERTLHRPLRRHLGLGRANAALVAGGRPDEPTRALLATLKVPWLEIDAGGRPATAARAGAGGSAA
ncbi:MAG: AMP-binding protein [Burkholderiales bacterium]|mgnify:FL=1|nr:AMP-binding protein [Burkholderiales bacterium]OJX05967.1 MAG: hypothetical protein BGO72_04760 [Burkholderiales bacterium 70-64]